MTRANFLAASTLVVLAIASPVKAQSGSGGGTTSGTGGGTRGTAPSRSALPNSDAHHLLGGFPVRLAGRRADSSDGNGQRRSVLATLAGDRRQ